MVSDRWCRWRMRRESAVTAQVSRPRTLPVAYVIFSRSRPIWQQTRSKFFCYSGRNKYQRSDYDGAPKRVYFTPSSKHQALVTELLGKMSGQKSKYLLLAARLISNALVEVRAGTTRKIAG